MHRINETNDEDSCFVNHSNKKEKKMKGLKRLAGVLGVIVLLCGMLTGCSGKKLYSEEELTQIHDVIGTVEQMTKEFQNVITDSLPTLLGDMSSSSDELMDFISTRKYDPNKKIIALTFDDGPSSDVTVRVLDTLKANGIKATFFICDYDEDKLPIIKRMIDEGHTIGIHGYSHDYSQIYTSNDAFMENINKLKNKLKEDTGYDAYVIRFPGGSSNTVSEKYCVGVMSQLVQTVTDSGLMYMDWNVSSGDAEGNNRPVNLIIKNVTGGFKHNRNNVVLMHDTSVKQTSADALQSIITYGKNNGYSFYPISKDTIPVHHGVNN